jgi:iron complex transport system ATP-binding protein
VAAGEAELNLEVKQLGICRGERTLLSGLDMHVQTGRVTVVLGPNGAGKSSLLMALAGQLQASSGIISLWDRPLSSLSRREIAAHVAWLGVWPLREFGLTVSQRLALSAQQNDDGIIASALQQLDLSGLGNHALDILSAGELQRVELAAVLLRNTPLWLLDEPMAHLDIRHQLAWLALMREQVKQRAIICVLHDLAQAASVADDVLLIYGDGRWELGEAGAILEPERLSGLYQASLGRWCHERGDGVVMPDYAGGCR